MNKHQVKVLSNLRPETIVAVKGVPFAIRGLALPGVEDARESLSEVAFVGAADAQEAIDVKAGLRIPPDTEERMVVMERFIVAGGLLLVLAVAFFAINDTSKPKTVPAMLTEGPQTAIGAFSMPALGQGSQNVQKAATSDSEGFCAGYEAMCSTSTTDKPAETLAKLAAALPVGEAKRYRVKVSVVPLDE